MISFPLTNCCRSIFNRDSLSFFFCRREVVAAAAVGVCITRLRIQIPTHTHTRTRIFNSVWYNRRFARERHHFPLTLDSISLSQLRGDCTPPASLYLPLVKAHLLRGANEKFLGIISQLLRSRHIHHHIHMMMSK